MCSVRSARCSLGPALAVLLTACAFPDVVELGAHESDAGRAGASAMRIPPSELCGSGGAGAPSPDSGTPDSSELRCGLPAPTAPSWIAGTHSDAVLTEGSGGSLVPGQYRLERLVEHGRCPCFDASSSFAQTLVLTDADSGYVVSEQNCAAHSAATFAFETQANAIRITPTCGAPPARTSELFGPFDTYTALGDVLVLVSTACRYRAEYRLDAVPAR